MDASGDQYGEDPVAPGHRVPDNLAVVRYPWDDGHAPLGRIEFRDALRAAHPDHVVAPAKGVLHHVLSELPGGSRDAGLYHRHPSRSLEPAMAA